MVIPLKNNQKTSAALAVLQNLKKTLDGEDDTDEKKQQNGNADKVNANKSETLEERSIKELLSEAKETDAIDYENKSSLTLPLNTNDVRIDGAKESTMDDYDDIPIAEFGMAMLRGMGLKDEEIRSKASKEPELRAKGMGLGADKMVKPKKLLVAPSINETLEIKKNACVRILAGKYKDLYGIIEGLDDDSGRVVVKLALGKARETLNEFMVQPVSKQEYAQYGKIINSAKYDAYKKKQDEAEKNKNESSSSHRRSPEPQTSRSSKRYSPERKSSRGRDRQDRPREDKIKNREKDYDRYNDRERRRSRSREYRRRSLSRERQSRTSNYDSYKQRDSHLSKNTQRDYDRKDDKEKSKKNRSESSSSSLSSSSSSSDSSSHHKKSKKKHKKSSKSRQQDRHMKKKTKKSKRQRSHSR